MAERAAQIRRLQGVLKEAQGAIVREVSSPKTLEAGDTPDEVAAARFSAMLEAAFLVATADGEVSEIELFGLAGILIDLTEGMLPDSAISELLASYAERLLEEGYEARIQYIAEQLPEADLRRAAFLLAAGIARVDGVVFEEEALVFGALALAFNIPEEEVEALLSQVAQLLSQAPAQLG